MKPQFSRIGDTFDVLGESPVWDPVEQALYWIDVESRIVRRREHASGRVDEWRVPQRVGSIGLAGRRDAAPGAVVAPLTDGVYSLDLQSGQCTRIADTEGDNRRTQFNDGKVDRVGNFVFGSMRVAAPDEGLGFMYRIDATGRVTTLDGGFSLFNGVCFSPDGRVVYYTDTYRRVIWAADYDPLGGIFNKRMFFDLRALDVLPDGATVDADGCVWSAFLLSAQLGRISPEGELLARIDLPVARPTSVAFGGPRMDVLYVTSSGRNRGVDDPQGGALIAIEGLGVSGIADARFNGRAAELR